MTTPRINKTMTPSEWGLLLGLSVIWGGSFFFNAVAVREVPVLTIVAVRLALAALGLWLVVLLSGQRIPATRRLWATFFILGLINNAIPFTLIVWGQSHIASGLAAILNATTPLFAVIIAHWATDDEKMTTARLIGVLTGLAGTVVMIGAQALGALGVGVLAELACLGAAIAYATAGVFGRRLNRLGVAPLMAATGQLSASSLILFPVALIVDRPWSAPQPGWTALAALVALALISTALAYIIYFRILARAGATNILLVTFLVPVSAILLGVLVLGETLEPQELAGMAMIGLGLAAIDGRPLKALRRMFAGPRADLPG